MTEPTAPIETNPPAPSTNTATVSGTDTGTSTQPSQSQPQSNSVSSSGYTYQKPRITVEYCTQCKWMLRAAYFAQELLSTFNTDIGEIALIPRTGGIFTVTLFATSSSAQGTTAAAEVEATVAANADDSVTPPVILWDRKRDGGFPEVKELKSRVRNVIDPNRDLGHTDRALKAKGESTSTAPAKAEVANGTGQKECEDCK